MAYRLTHPNSKLEIVRDAADVPMYLTQGWRTKPGVKVPEADTPAPVATPAASDDA